jgi:hypothetical protein
MGGRSSVPAKLRAGPGARRRAAFFADEQPRRQQWNPPLGTSPSRPTPSDFGKNWDRTFTNPKCPITGRYGDGFERMAALQVRRRCWRPLGPCAAWSHAPPRLASRPARAHARRRPPTTPSPPLPPVQAKYDPTKAFEPELWRRMVAGEKYFLKPRCQVGEGGLA